MSRSLPQRTELGRFTLSGGTVSATTNTIPGGTQMLIAHYEGDWDLSAE